MKPEVDEEIVPQKLQVAQKSNEDTRQDREPTYRERDVGNEDSTQLVDTAGLNGNKCPDSLAYEEPDAAETESSVSSLSRSWRSCTEHIFADESIPPDTLPDVAHLGLDDALHRIGQSTIGVDLYGRSPTARFFRHLIDIIQGQQQEIDYLEQTGESSSFADSNGSADQLASQWSTPPSFQTMHAVVCATHTCHTAFYEDMPTTRSLPSWRRGPRYRHLTASGKHLIGASLKQYLETKLSLHAVVLFVIDCPERIESLSTQGEDSEAIPLQAKVYIIARSLAMKDFLTEGAKFPIPECSNARLSKDLNIAECGWIIEKNWFYFRHRKLLRQKLDFSADSAKDELGPVQDELRTVLRGALEVCGAIWDEACDLVEDQHSRGVVTRSSFALLFHPNMAVVAQPAHAKGDLIVCMIRSISTMASGDLRLSTWTWEFDGRKFYRMEVLLFSKLPPIRESRITDLDVYPLAHAAPSQISSIRERSEKLWSLRRHSFISYQGWDANNDRLYNGTRFIVDVATRRRLHNSHTPSFTQANDEWTLGLPQELSIEEHMPEGITLLAMPALVPGYDLQDKKWVTLRVDNIRNITFNKAAFESLMVPRNIKDLVRALVVTHDSVEGPSDVIEGKGSGLILLLHGSPGTGKTLTAESVAEIAEKPLYRVTCGDIGTDANSMESYLETVLYLGKTWNCVILFDEADVFLEERDLFDLQRNSIVSVFLRTLEYYEGILILTSNRVGTFDEAFKSRIQVAIHYPDLTRVTRKKIWQSFIDKIEESDLTKIDTADISEHMSELADLELNGRQIRNAINTARRVAVFREERLAWEHVLQVTDVAGQFSKYLERTHRHTDNERARETGIRA